MKRYDMEAWPGFTEYQDLVEHEDGDWIRYEDHAVRVAELAGLVSRLVTYGEHAPSCGLFSRTNKPACSCGFAETTCTARAALTRLREEPDPGEPCPMCSGDAEGCYYCEGTGLEGAH